MNKREEIEKKFDERFPDGFHEYITRADIKSFFFDKILPEVLRDLLPKEIKNNIDEAFVHHILKKSRKYNIIL